MVKDRKTKDVLLFSEIESEQEKSKQINSTSESQAEEQLISSNEEVFNQEVEQKEATDLNIESESTSQNLEENEQVPQSELKDSENADSQLDAEKSDHEFYKKSDTAAKKKSKRKWIIIGVLVVVLLSLGFGLGFGLTGRNKDQLKYHFGNGSTISDEEILAYVDLHLDDDKNDVDNLTNQAIVWEYDQLHEDGLVTDSQYYRVKDKAEDDAQTQIDNEKEDYRDQYGDDWLTEWNSYLIESGYDTEEEYKNGLIADEIKLKDDDVYTGIHSINYVTDTSNYKYSSTVSNNDGTYEVLNNGTEIDGDPTVNSEMYFEGYSNIDNPAAYYDILLPFTFDTDSYNGMKMSNFLFEDTTEGTVKDSRDNMQTDWEFTSDYFISAFDNSKSMKLNDYIPTYSGMVSLDTPAEDQFVNNALMQLFVLDQSGQASLASTFIPLQTHETQGSDDFNLLNALYVANDGIGKTITIQDDNGNYDPWAGYENGNLVGDYTDDNGRDSIKGIDSNYWNLTSNEIEEIGKEYYQLINSYNDDGNMMIFANPDPNDGTPRRTLYAPVEINYQTNYYTLDGDNNAVSVSSNSSDREEAYAVLSNNGLHFIIPAIYLDDDLGWTYPQAMLVSDLDKDMQTSSNPYLEDFGILDSYDTWFESVSDYIYLNDALGNQEFIDKYIEDENDDGTNADEFDLIIQTFYNDIYMSSYLKFLSGTSSNFWDFQATYSDLYLFPDDSNTQKLISDTLIAGLVFFQHPPANNDFDWQPTSTILTEGLLYDK